MCQQVRRGTSHYYSPLLPSSPPPKAHYALHRQAAILPPRMLQQGQVGVQVAHVSDAHTGKDVTHKRGSISARRHC